MTTKVFCHCSNVVATHHCNTTAITRQGHGLADKTTQSVGNATKLKSPHDTKHNLVVCKTCKPTTKAETHHSHVLVCTV